MTTTTEASTAADEKSCGVCGRDHIDRYENVRDWLGTLVRTYGWSTDPDPHNEAGARLLLPFTERAGQHPDPERVMREGLSFVSEFGGGPAEDEAALIRSARRFLDRNYPVAVAP